MMMMWTRRDTVNTSPKYYQLLDWWVGEEWKCALLLPHRKKMLLQFDRFGFFLQSDSVTCTFSMVFKLFVVVVFRWNGLIQEVYKCVQTNEASLSQENTTAKSQPSFVHCKKIPMFKTKLDCPFKCKIQHLNHTRPSTVIIKSILVICPILESYFCHKTHSNPEKCLRNEEGGTQILLHHHDNNTVQM